MATPRKSTTSTRQTLKKSSKKGTAEDKLIDEGDDMIRHHPKDQGKFLCTLCHKYGSTYHTGLWHNRKDHQTSQSHKKCEEKARDDLIEHEQEAEAPSNGNDKTTQNNESKATASIELTPVVKAELDLTYTKFLVQYRLPLSMAGPLNKFTQQVSLEYPPNILRDYTVNRQIVTKASNIVCDTLKADMYYAMKNSPFSISIDTSSDVHGHTYLAICIRYLEENNFERPVTKLFSILPITDSSTGETISNKIMTQIFVNDDVKLNLMGIVTDDGPNMTGCDQGVSQRLKDVCKHIVIFKDISHGLNNIFKKALKAIPAKIPGIVKSICTHFHRSIQRTALLKQILIDKNMKSLEILNMTDTRWLSIRDSIERILDLWIGLETYFAKYGSDTQKDYFSAANQLAIKILELLVNNIVDCNEHFQTENLLYNEVFEKMKHSYVVIANIIIKKDRKSMDFDKVFAIPFEKNTHKDIRAGKFDAEVKTILVTSQDFETEYLMKYDSIKELLTQVSQSEKEEILSASIRFLYICLHQMKNNLPFSNEYLNLSQVLFFEEEFNEDKWLKLRDLFPNVLRTRKQRDDFATEVRKMEYTYNKIKARIMISPNRISPIMVWRNEFSIYPNVSLMANALFVLPYSSVPVERVFSTMKDILSAKRNRLTVDNMEACLLGYQASRTETFVIDDDMIETYISKKKVVNRKTKKEPAPVQAPEQRLEKEQEKKEAEEQQDQALTAEEQKEDDHENISQSDDNDDDEVASRNFVLVQYRRNELNPQKRALIIRSQETQVGMKMLYKSKN